MNEERPIEKLLRRHAQKRRDEAGPPPELHPATRRLLQGEVARQFSRPGPVGRPGFGAMLRARWTYAAAGVAAVGVGIMLLLPPLRDKHGAAPLAKQDAEMTLAKATTLNDEKFSEAALKKLPAEKMESTAATPTPVAAPAVSLDAGTTSTGAPRTEAPTQLSFDDRATRRLEEAPTLALAPRAQPADLDKSIREDSAAATAQTDAERFNKVQREQAARLAPTLAERKTAPVGLAGASRDSVAGKDLLAGENRLAAVPPSRVPTSATTSEARSRKTALARGGGLERPDQATVSQAFANLAPTSAEGQKQKAAPTAPVLVNFRIEQNGDQWRVIDGDGSTYFGVSPPAADEADKLQPKGIAAAPTETARAVFSERYGLRANVQNVGKYFHRVEGTNRTLQQPVAFEWNFVAPTNAPGAMTQTVGGAVQAMPIAPWVNSVVNGQVQINTRPQFELNAAPVSR